MDLRTKYASVAILESLSEGKIAIQTLFVQQESCELTGAWIFNDSDIEDIRQLLDHYLVITIGTVKIPKQIAENISPSEVNIQDFINEAIFKVKFAEEAYSRYLEEIELEYSKYMAIDVASRKLLPKLVKKKPTRPRFFAWPTSIDLNESEHSLKTFGRKSVINGSDLRFSKVLPATRLVRFLIEMWRNDENERSIRPYIYNDSQQYSFLPGCWLASKKLDV